MTRVKRKLESVFGFHSFQPGQEAMISDVIDGKNVLGVLPTGSGKSLCYQLPATILDGITIVVSPLISLMIDQVRQIKAYYFKEVAAIHSFLSFEEKQMILNHLSAYKLLFVSPELLQQPYLIRLLKKYKISLFCIDEAHCISQWGYDFRTDYLKLNQVIKEIQPKSILALTGTASNKVQQDIINKLELPQVTKHIHSMVRENIALVIKHIQGNEADKLNDLVQLVNRVEWPVIIYFSSRKTTEQVAKSLVSHLSHAKTAYYHAGVHSDSRLKIQEQFMNNQLDIICSTSAFGMGINKKDIRTVIHYHPPTQIESFIQEIGRAGRDGKQSVSILMLKNNDFEVPNMIIENELPTQTEIKKVLLYIEKQLKLEVKEIVHKVGISETKWRFLEYHLESKGFLVDQVKKNTFQNSEALFNELYTICQNRYNIKTKKLDQMKKWAYTPRSNCLHEELYGVLQSNVSPKAKNCCSHCGYELMEIDRSKMEASHSSNSDWQELLSDLLFYKDILDEKQSN